MRSLRKIPAWLRGTCFRINYTNSPCFASSFMRLRNDPKCTQTLCNAPKHEFRVQWIGCVRCKKSRRNFVAKTFALIAPVHPVLHRVSCSYETIWNAPKYYATHQNMSLRSNVADWVRSLWKIPAWLRGMYFCINCTSSHYYAPSFMQLRNNPKCTQTLSNALEHEFRVQWGESGVLIAKNYNATSWHKLLH